MKWHGLFVCNKSPFCLSHSRMRPVIRFAVVLVVGLGLVAAIASILFNKTVHSWFENDVRLRAEIAVKGARQAFVERYDDRERLERPPLGSHRRPVPFVRDDAGGRGAADD